MSFRSEIDNAARQAGGSFQTRAARQQIVGQLASYLQRNNIQIRNLDQLKEKHLKDWIRESKDAGISDRSCQNRLTAIRVTLRAAGLSDKATRIRTQDYGVDKANRDGSRRAISNAEFKERLEKVRDIGIQTCLEMQRTLGLRQLEAIRARADTLQRWAKELAGGGSIHVAEGTKGGRPRETRVVDREAAIQVVAKALSIAQKNPGGRVVNAPGLKEAKDRFNNQARAAGFVGELSPHSCRYAFACDSINRYLERGFSYREATLLTSIDLGHGDGRGRWVSQVYSRT